ncbi:hypothetical protein BGZ50_007728 [Haplosporangium sp. Z 11]|nr:hypothetical protein BGZ50_007728 [Haplosporangium sp. Z 11]
MLFKSIATVVALAGLAAAQSKELTHGQADVNMNNIEATFTFDKVAGGMNISVAVAKGLTSAIQVLPTGFDYHVHVHPVGPNNNCTATGAHLDPAKVGVAKPCDPTNLTTCQTGDLAGKYGNLMGTADGSIPKTTYLDTQLTFTGEGEEAMVGRSIVIHNNGTRIACANIVVDGYNASTPTDGGKTDGGKTEPKTGENSAAKLAGSVALTGLVAMMMMAL